jgi:hypothetical protein
VGRQKRKQKEEHARRVRVDETAPFSHDWGNLGHAVQTSGPAKDLNLGAYGGFSLIIARPYAAAAKELGEERGHYKTMKCRECGRRWRKKGRQVYVIDAASLRMFDVGVFGN